MRSIATFGSESTPTRVEIHWGERWMPHERMASPAHSVPFRTTIEGNENVYTASFRPNRILSLQVLLKDQPATDMSFTTTKKQRLPNSQLRHLSDERLLANDFSDTSETVRHASYLYNYYYLKANSKSNTQYNDILIDVHVSLLRCIKCRL